MVQGVAHVAWPGLAGCGIQAWSGFPETNNDSLLWRYSFWKMLQGRLGDGDLKPFDDSPRPRSGATRGVFLAEPAVLGSDADVFHDNFPISQRDRRVVFRWKAD